MSDSKSAAKTPTATASSARPAQKRVFKYPAEEETYVRRLGAAVLAVWPELDAGLRQKLLAEAATAWDREYNIDKLPAKLEAFIKKHPARVG